MTMKLNRKTITDEFARYTNLYNANDPKIKLKIDHTYRVADFAEQIAKSLGMTETDVDIAWSCGMLHDVGRFEQVKRYGTFSDAASIDHAQFGANLLFKEGLYQTYFDEESQAFCKSASGIIECAIREHSAFRVSEGLSERELTFANILRDADKIDIFRVNCDTPIEDIYNVTTEELKHAEVSEQTMADFLEEHCVLRAHKHTAVDNIVGMISLYFELVYPLSKQLAESQGYLDQLLSFESENPKTQACFEKMRRIVRGLAK